MCPNETQPFSFRKTYRVTVSLLTAHECTGGDSVYFHASTKNKLQQFRQADRDHVLFNNSHIRTNVVSQFTAHT